MLTGGHVGILYCIVLYCIVLYCIVLYCIVLYCIVLYCIVLYCIVLYCIVSVLSSDDLQKSVILKLCIIFPTFSDVVEDCLSIFTMMSKSMKFHIWNYT